MIGANRRNPDLAKRERAANISLNIQLLLKEKNDHGNDGNGNSP